ncbi:MAG TPA: OsmC family protein [Candidatus Dormibacteraeota bacterium]|nr:OsmC family protein [Candidatus Dormibacteraeota bacterium]
MNPAKPPSPSSTPGASIEFAIEIEQTDDYAFRVRFDKEQFPPLMMDEPAPLGQDSGPNASRLLAAAVGNCLSASLLFCARKGRIKIGLIRTRVHAHLARNERGRWRVVKLQVEIDPQVPEAEKQNALRCLDLFEDYCVVTESVRRGIPVEVSVKGLEELRVPPPE